jgi:hypothetical protein
MTAAARNQGRDAVRELGVRRRIREADWAERPPRHARLLRVPPQPRRRPRLANGARRTDPVVYLQKQDMRRSDYLVALLRCLSLSKFKWRVSFLE